MAAYTLAIVLLACAPLCMGSPYEGCETLRDTIYCRDEPKHSFSAVSNYTQMPNALGDKTQRDAALGIDLMAQVMMNMGLRAPYNLNYRRFSCSMFFPPCLRDGSTPPPCKELCMLAKEAGREAEKLGHQWPAEYNCDKFPSMASETVICIPPYSRGSTAADEDGNIITGGSDEQTGEPNQDGASTPSPQDPTCVNIKQPFTMNGCTCTCNP